jgi:type II secretory pathway pseudopilin PulG
VKKQRKPNFWKNSDGFSLAEVMVAAGMLGLLSLAIMQITQNANKVTKSVSQKVEMTQLFSNVQRALTDSDACTQTFTAANPNVVLINNLGATGARNVLFGSKAGTVFTKALISGMEYGKGTSGAVTVKSITVMNWTKTGEDTSADETYGTVDLEVRLSRGHASATDETIKVSSFGMREVAKRFPINIAVRTSTNAVKSCFTGNASTLSEACKMFDGELISAGGDLKCHNIKIVNTDDAASTENQTRKYSIIARGAPTLPNGQGSMKAEGGLVVGSADDTGNVYSKDDQEVVGPGNGLAFIQNGLFVGTDPTKGTIPTGGAQLLGNLEVGVTGDSDAIGHANITGTLKILNEGNTDPENDPAVMVTDGKVLFENGSTAKSSVEINKRKDSNGKIKLNGSPGTPIEVREGSNLIFTVNEDGYVGIRPNTGTIALGVEDVNGRKRLKLETDGSVRVMSSDGAQERIVLGGKTSGSYRASYIYNMPEYSSSSLSNEEQSEIPTKKWVLGALYHFLSDEVDFNSLVPIIQQAISSNPFDAVAKYVCQTMRVRVNGGAIASGVWSGGTCSINVSAAFNACGTSASNRCAAHYSVSYNASGSIYASSQIRAGGEIRADGHLRGMRNLYLSGRAYIYSHLDVSGRIYTPSYIFARSYIRGYGASKYSLAGVCGRYGCASRFGRQRCSNGGFVIGIANGRLVCGRNNGGGTGPYNF